tara:strand:- start:322 stop:1317 length:996 start_codon:yes stop_codon:yes gene_type:complete
LILVACGLALFGGLVWQADPSLVWRQLQALGAWAPALLLPSLGIYLVDACAWRFCFREAPPVGYWRLFLVRMAGESLNNSLPSAYLGGEPLKAYLLQREGLAGPEGIASVVVGKTSLTVAQVGFLFAGMACALAASSSHASLPALVTGSALVTALFLGSMTLAYLAQRHGPGRLLRALSERTGLLRTLVARSAPALDELDQTLGDYYAQAPGRFWTATGLFLLAWCGEFLEIALFCQLSGLGPSWLALIALGSLATVAKAAGLFLPGSLGVQEGGNVLLFLAFGLSESLAITFSLVRRARELFWIGFGLLALSFLGGIRAPSLQEEPTPDE